MTLYFAKLDENNLVSQVVALSEDQCHDADGNCDEIIGLSHCKKTISSGTWIRCYQDGTRGQMPSVGYSYSSSDDVFVTSKPHSSWVLDTSKTNWTAPITRPVRTTDQMQGGFDYVWDEDAYQADNTTGWTLTKLYPEE